ncbi:hypothetical protein ACA910_022701 [Epithemia clementina (nom. ined.)]
MKSFYFASCTMVIANLVAFGATMAPTSSTRRSPGLLRRRGFSPKEAKNNAPAKSTSTGEDLYRALSEGFAISAFHLAATGANLDWPPQQNSGSFSFSFFYPLASFSYLSANTYLSFSYPPFEKDLSFSFPPFENDLSFSFPPFENDLSFSFPPFGTDLSFSFPTLESDLSFSFPTVETDLSFSLPRGGWSLSFPPAPKDHLSFSFPNIIDDGSLSNSMSYPPSSSDMSFSFSYLDRSDVNVPIHGRTGTTGDSFGTNHETQETFNQGGVSSSDNAGGNIASKAGASNSNSPVDEEANGQGVGTSPVDTSVNNQEHKVATTGKASNNNAGAGSVQGENDLYNNVPSSIEGGITSRGKNGDDISVGVLITVVSGTVLIFGLVFVALSRKLRRSQYGSAAAASLFGSDGSAESSVSAAETGNSGSSSRGVGAVAV